MKVVLIRGLAREAEHWGDFAKILEDRLRNIFSDKSEQNHDLKGVRNIVDTLEILTPDCPGCGKYHKESACSSIGATTEHIRQQLISSSVRAREIEPESVILVGISMGGMVAMDWAHRYPSELKALAVINSSSGRQKFWWRIKPAALLPTLLSLLAPMPWREATMLKLVSNATREHDNNIRFWQKIQEKRPVKRITMIKQLSAAARFSANFKKSLSGNSNEGGEGLPGLILASKKDRLVSWRCSETIANELKWPLVVHEQAGHDLPLDAPEWLAEQICIWLTQKVIEKKAGN